MIDLAIQSLIDYGIRNSLIEPDDNFFIRNQLLGLLHLSTYTKSDEKSIEDLPTILKCILDYAVSQHFIDDNIVSRDLFDTEVMGILTPRPSQVIKHFYELAPTDSKTATDYFYDLSQKCNYIRTDRIAKDLKWKYHSNYGDIDITVNMSKPEKDPKAIAALKNQPTTSYPTCVLCRENEGFFGSLTRQARENLRLIPLTLGGENWYFQYSPYVYYQEHCIILSETHRPMKIDVNTFDRLTEFVDKFPHYILGSNADLPIVGGSVLTHDHYQGGNYEFAMSKAEYRFVFAIPHFENVKAGILNWPVSVIRLQSRSRKDIVQAASHILSSWRSYSDESVNIIAYTDNVPHNTISPIARKKGDFYELDLALRNNRTTAERPLGLFHPRAEYWHLKKENIGLIEVLGLAILPSRLKKEIEELKDAILNHVDYRAIASIAKHADWADKILSQYRNIDKTNIDRIMEEEIGYVFTKVLEDVGVFKNDLAGQDAYRRFIKTL